MLRERARLNSSRGMSVKKPEKVERMFRVFRDRKVDDLDSLKASLVRHGFPFAHLWSYTPFLSAEEQQLFDIMREYGIDNIRKYVSFVYQPYSEKAERYARNNKLYDVNESLTLEGFYARTEQQKKLAMHKNNKEVYWNKLWKYVYYIYLNIILHDFYLKREEWLFLFYSNYFMYLAGAEAQRYPKVVLIAKYGTLEESTMTIEPRIRDDRYTPGIRIDDEWIFWDIEWGLINQISNHYSELHLDKSWQYNKQILMQLLQYREGNEISLREENKLMSEYMREYDPFDQNKPEGRLDYESIPTEAEITNKLLCGKTVIHDEHGVYLTEYWDKKPT